MKRFKINAFDIKRLSVLALAAPMIFSMPVMAKEVGAPVAVYLDDSSDVGDPAVTLAAIEEEKLVGEYMNNAVTGIWAMDKVTPVAQGGGVIVDGVATNLTFSVLKPELSRVYSAKELASSFGGCVLNVVKIKTPAELRFQVANVNFYTPGIRAGQNVRVYKYTEGEGWTQFHVTQVREDHVVVDMTSGGILAFIEVPA